MKYEEQITESSCIPASISMILDHMDIDFGMSQEDLILAFKTDIDGLGTYYKDVNKFLRPIGLKLNMITKKKASEMMKNNKPFIVTYMNSFRESHCSIVIGMEKCKDCYKVILQDPYYGKSTKIPIGVFEQVWVSSRTLDIR